MKNKKLFAILTLVCFMMTLMPVAAFAAVDADTSYIYTVKENPTVKLNDETEAEAKIVVDFRNASDATTAAATVYVWVTEAGKDTPSTALKSIAGVDAENCVVELPAATVADMAEVVAVFQRTGTFTLHATTDTVVGGDVSEVAEFSTIATNNKVTVKGSSVSPSEYVVEALNEELVGLVAADDETFGNTVDGEFEAEKVYVAADGLADKTLKFRLYATDAMTNVVKGATVNVETSSANIEVSKTKVTTNVLGDFSFDVTGLREGSYEIYISCGSYEATVEVVVGAVTPAYINVVKAPTAPINIDETEDLSNVVRFLITDINGNTLTSAQADDTELAFTAEDKYVSIISQPEDSDLESEDVYLINDTHASNDGVGIYSTLAIEGGLDAEGTYKFRVALANGKSVTVSVEAREFGTPVDIVLEYAAPAVELGATLATKDLLFVDKNGVTSAAAGKVELAASGYAIDNFFAADVPLGGGKKIPAGTIIAKTDEKYLGSTITVTAVSERYNLTKTATVKVVAEAAGLMFTSKTAEVDVNNAIQVVLVDAQGNRLALGSDAEAAISYVVLDKPEGAKVSVNTAAADENLSSAGSFKMNLTCNKIGTVKVQAIAKVTKLDDGKEVVKYYTGIGEIAVGNGQVGKSVVMSIGSNTMIADGKVATVDAQPMIQNGRTFVPFRALAEAFGATVAYDQATSAVKATLNGVEVVMTVGSPVYTVNGVEKTADVAPFIADSRTFVPVRFAAEAFGITVTPTYNTDGSVADVLFNM